MTCPRCGGPVEPCPLAAAGFCPGTVHVRGGTHGCPQPRAADLKVCADIGQLRALIDRGDAPGGA